MNTYHRRWIELTEAEKLLSTGITSNSDEELRNTQYSASARLTEADKLSYSFKTELAALGEAHDSPTQYRISELTEASRVVVQLQLQGKPLVRGDVQTLRDSLVRLRQELPEPTGATFEQILPRLSAVSASDQTLVSIINKDRAAQ